MSDDYEPDRRSDAEAYCDELRAQLAAVTAERDAAHEFIRAIEAAMPGNTYAHGHTALCAVEGLVAWSREATLDNLRLTLRLEEADSEIGDLRARLVAVTEERDALRAVVTNGKAAT